MLLPICGKGIIHFSSKCHSSGLLPHFTVIHRKFCFQVDNKNAKLESTGYCALPLPLRLMRRAVET